MDERPSRRERRRARWRHEDDRVVEEGSCTLMSSLVLYPVGSLAAFVIVLTGTRVDPVTLDRFGRTKGATVEGLRLTIQELNGGPVSLLEMAILAGVLFVIVPALLWSGINGRPRRLLRVIFWFLDPRFKAAVERHQALGVVQLAGHLATFTLGIWLPMLLGLAIVWAPPR